MSQNITPLSACELWNLVADGYAEFWGNMVKDCAPIQMMKLITLHACLGA